MEKYSQFDQQMWYELWSKQNQLFFETGETYLKNVFKQNKTTHPEDHLDEINHWLEAFKQKWQEALLNTAEPSSQLYLKAMSTMWSDAVKLLMFQWSKRAKEESSIQSIKELYELWLNCCHETYQKMLKTPSYQQMYKECMNEIFKYWEISLSK